MRRWVRSVVPFVSLVFSMAACTGRLPPDTAAPLPVVDAGVTDDDDDDDDDDDAGTPDAGASACIDQPQACAQLGACVAALVSSGDADAEQADDVERLYGADSPCWCGDAAESQACTDACVAELAARGVNSDEGACSLATPALAAVTGDGNVVRLTAGDSDVVAFTEVRSFVTFHPAKSEAFSIERNKLASVNSFLVHLDRTGFGPTVFVASNERDEHALDVDGSAAGVCVVIEQSTSGVNTLLIVRHQGNLPVWTRAAQDLSDFSALIGAPTAIAADDDGGCILAIFPNRSVAFLSAFNAPGNALTVARFTEDGGYDWSVSSTSTTTDNPPPVIDIAATADGAVVVVGARVPGAGIEVQGRAIVGQTGFAARWSASGAEEGIITMSATTSIDIPRVARHGDGVAFSFGGFGDVTLRDAAGTETTNSSDGPSRAFVLTVDAAHDIALQRTFDASIEVFPSALSGNPLAIALSFAGALAEPDVVAVADNDAVLLRLDDALAVEVARVIASTGRDVIEGIAAHDGALFVAGQTQNDALLGGERQLVDASAFQFVALEDDLHLLQ
jgi:hypothetical protein